MEEEKSEVLLIDEEFSPILTEADCEALKPIIKRFMKAYVDNKDRPVKEWLKEQIAKELPEKTNEEVESITNEIIESLEVADKSKASLEQAIEDGRSKESWFASKITEATSVMTSQEAMQYMNNLDSAMTSANEALARTITTNAGNISQNPCLDGYIAEQYHAQTFNLNAEASGSEYRAKVLEPNGKGYAKNSVDVVIVDGKGKIVKRYQVKYCKDAKATAKAYKKGDYRGQRKLVAADQKDGVKNSTDYIESPDGTRSNPATKKKVKDLQEEAQSGNWTELNWNEYKTKDLAIGVSRQAGYAALQGAAIGVGFDLAGKVFNGEEIDGAEVVEKALKTGADHGIKAAVSGAVKVGAEKGILTCIPKGTPAGNIANIVHIGIENAKILGGIFTGKYSLKEGFEKIEENTISTAGGLLSTGKGAAIGASIGSVLGPIGSAVGGFVGGTVGFMAGSTVGKAIAKTAKKVRETATKVVSTVAKGVGNAVKAVTSGVGKVFRGIASFFGF